MSQHLEESLLDDDDSDPIDEVDEPPHLDRDYFPVLPEEQEPSFTVRCLRKLLSSQFITYFLIVIYLSLVVLVALSVLIGLETSVNHPIKSCSKLNSLENQWKLWALVSVIRMTFSAFILYRRYVLVNQLGLVETHEDVKTIHSARNILEALGILWFILGNLWLLSDHQYIYCGFRYSSIYYACLLILTLQYLQLCFPFLAALFLAPILCCCLPSFLQTMTLVRDENNQGLHSNQGAQVSLIETLPKIIHKKINHDEKNKKYQSNKDIDEDDEEDSCPICLGCFENGDELRVLPCHHTFHVRCVDNWLILNATCPNCRSDVFNQNLTPPESSSNAEPVEEEELFSSRLINNLLRNQDHGIDDGHDAV